PRCGNPAKPSSLPELTVRVGADEQSGNCCRYYYWRTVLGQPAGMAAKVARQFTVFYRIGRCPAYVTNKRIDLSKEYRRSSESLALQQKLLRYPPGAALVAHTETLSDSAPHVGPYKLTGRINQFLSKSHLICCVWAVLLGVCAWRIQPIRAVFGIAAPVL